MYSRIYYRINWVTLGKLVTIYLDLLFFFPVNPDLNTSFRSIMIRIQEFLLNLMLQQRLNYSIVQKKIEKIKNNFKTFATILFYSPFKALGSGSVYQMRIHIKETIIMQIRIYKCKISKFRAKLNFDVKVNLNLEYKQY